jgi:type II secretory pathway predicted ATPase ExeA
MGDKSKPRRGLRVKSTKLKLVEKPTEWGNGFAAFRERHGLSWRDFEAACGGTISRRSLHRLSQGDADPKYLRTLKRPLIIEALRRYLESKQVAPAQMQLELRSIFCKEEIEPVLTKRETLSRSAQVFFGLKGDPFPNEPPRHPSETYTNAELDKIVRKLEDAIRYQGFLCVIGSRGSGKSFIRRRIDDICERSNGKLVILYPEFANMDQVHSASICSFILHSLGEKAPQDRLARYRRLKEMLKGLSDQGVRIALAFDECHRLDPRLLTALKNFWEMGNGGYDRWLGLILFGWPSFQTTLTKSDFWEITERLKMIEMPTLKKDAWAYVAHRMKLVGGNAEKLIEPSVVSEIVKIGNTPLALGNLMNKTLLAAYNKNEKKVTLKLLASVIRPESGEPSVRALSR